MAAFRRGQLFLPPLMHCRSNFTTRKAKNKVLPRRIFEIVTQPILPEMLEPPLKECSYKNFQKLKAERAVEEENLYEQFLVRQCQKMFSDNKMIIVCGRLPATKRDTMLLGKAYKRSDFNMQMWSNEIVKKTIADSKWENLNPVITQHNCFITSPDIRVKDALKIAKKTPQIFVMAGIIENYLLSKDELAHVATLPSHDQLLGQTVWLLGSTAGKTHSLLSSHQQELSRSLSQFISDQQAKHT